MQKLMMVSFVRSLVVAICATAAISAEDLAAAVKERRRSDEEDRGAGGQARRPDDEGRRALRCRQGRQGHERHQRRAGQICDAVPEGNGAWRRSRTARRSPKIWEDFDDFKALATKLKDASAKAAGAAEQGKGTFTAAFNDMTKVCKECHETYREKLE